MSTITVGPSYFYDLYDSIQKDIYSCAFPAEEMSSDFAWTSAMGDSLNSKIFSLLNTKGFVLISIESPNDIHELINWQNKFLGPSMKDRGHDKGGYSEVMAEKNGKFFVNSNLTQPIHTDEGHASVFPRYFSLYCRTPSPSGGISTLVHSETLLRNIKITFGDQVRQLFKQKAINVKNVSGYESKNILMRLSDGRTGISYSPILQGLTCEPAIFDMFSNITNFVHDPKNQVRFKLKSGQLLIIDNCIVLHGRTKYLASDDRILYRMWFSESRLSSGVADLTV
jgi:hypothetical protein